MLMRYHVDCVFPNVLQSVLLLRAIMNGMVHDQQGTENQQCRIEGTHIHSQILFASERQSMAMMPCFLERSRRLRYLQRGSVLNITAPRPSVTELSSEVLTPTSHWAGGLEVFSRLMSPPHQDHFLE